MILALNCGSSSVKFRAYAGAPAPVARPLVEGRTEPVRDYGAAVRDIIERLAANRSLPRLVAVGHRVVHGGSRFTASVVVDDAVIADLEALLTLAPLHNGPSVAAIRVAREVLGDAMPMVAVFDTAFHATLPDVAARYALPDDLATRHGIRRFGFHGLAYRSVVDGYARLTGTPPERATIVALHLGAGCSAAAIRHGRSIDTSMGFTPLEGLMMVTRSGDVDPGLVGHLARVEGVGVDEVERWLNTRSGLLGVGGVGDMRELLERAGRGDARARLAVEMFCYRARKYVGAYLAALGGADAVVWSGGIGERAPAIRAGIAAGLDAFGLTLDPRRNAAAVDVAARISADGARLAAFVVPADEEAVIAAETAACLAGRAATAAEPRR